MQASPNAARKALIDHSQLSWGDTETTPGLYALIKAMLFATSDRLIGFQGALPDPMKRREPLKVTG